MNISQTFIERPIATSLLMAAIALFGTWPTGRLPVSDLPNVDLPTLLVTASLAGREPGDHGRGRRDAARKSVLDDCRAELDDFIELAGQYADHAGIRPGPEAGRRGGGRAGRHHAGFPHAAAGHADAADVHQGQSRRPADPLHRADLADAAAVHPRRICRDAHRAAHLDDFAAWRRCRCWARRSTPFTCRWIRTRWPRGRWASTRSRPR